MQREVLNWTGGAFLHNHFRIDDLVRADDVVIPREMIEYMLRYRDGSFSLPAITAYLSEMFGEKLLITDTQHPAYVLDSNYDDFGDEDKVQFFQPNALEKTVELLTNCIVQRMQIIRQFTELSHVLSGVEVDILSPTGRLSVHDDGLKQLDYVTASFHSSLWYAAGRDELTGNGFINMYNHVVDNPHIDALSHPTFYLPRDTKLQMRADDWVELFQNMRDRQVAFEINLDSTNLAYAGEDNLDRELISLALKIGTPLVIGFDFHYMADWGVAPSPSAIMSAAEAKGLFKIHVLNGSVNKLLCRVLGNIYALQQLGLTSSNIINSTPEQFLGWLERN